MANGTSAPAARETERKSFSAPMVFVDEKRFESEIRRIDASFSEEKKNREKFETRIEKAIFDLRGEVNAKFDKVDTRLERVECEIKDLRTETSARMDRLEDRLWWIFGAVILSILVPVLLKYL